MGNSVDSKMSVEKPVAVVNPMPAVNPQVEPKEKPITQPKTNVSVQLFHYRQQIGLKQHQVIKWATSKLLLTEELLKQEQQRQRLEQRELSEDAAWAEYQLAMLTDDEDDELNDNAENRAPPANDALGTERSNLLNYRVKLRDTIVELAQEKLRKREKTKVKRLKRRTLISSKKPSNKDKHRNRYSY